jgi:hypothetical protein
VTPADIGRPSGIQDVGPNAALVCAAQGDNRPPEDGIYCRVMNTLDNTTIFQGRVYDADPGNNMYYNMPYTADLGNGYFAISAQRSNGAGKNNNNKGAALGVVKVFKWDGIDLIEMGEYNDIGGLATHLSLTNSVVTIDGVTKNRMTFLGSPITGSGPASLTFMSFDELTNGITFDKQRVAHAYNSDAGKISNIYGENPNDQGRDFHTVLGNVPNPSYGAPTGYMPEVQSFMVITTHGRNAGDMKNGMHLRFLPSQTDTSGVDDDCVINPDTCETPPPGEEVPDVDEDADGDDNPAPGDWGSPQAGNPSLLGCHIGTGRAAGGSALLLLGLALLVIRRRR